jgi:hypothetical protein
MEDEESYSVFEEYYNRIFLWGIKNWNKNTKTHQIYYVVF